MTDLPLPAVALAAVPGRRRKTLDLAREIEQRGFAGIYCASFGDAMGLCEALALTTERIPFGTAIANLYTSRRSQIVSLLTLAKQFLAEAESIRRFRFCGKRNQNVRELSGYREGPLSAQDRSFVEGQPSDRSIRIANVR